MFNSLPSALVVHQRISHEASSPISQLHPIAPLTGSPVDGVVQFFQEHHELLLLVVRHGLQHATRNGEVLCVGQFEPAIDSVPPNNDGALSLFALGDNAWRSISA